MVRQTHASTECRPDPMAEPFVTLTDFAIALQTLGFALWLWPLGKTERCWALAFASVGLAALLGGLYHGWGPAFPYAWRLGLWQGMIIALSLASFWLLIAAAWPLPRPWKFCAMVLAIGKLFLLLNLEAIPWTFGPRVADYLLTLMVVPGLWKLRGQPPSSQRWLTVGVAISLIAVLILALPEPHPFINPFVSYHLIQMVGLFCLFWGIRLAAVEVKGLELN